MHKLFALLFLISISGLTYAQKVYSVSYSNQADVKIFVVKYENQAYENQAGWNEKKKMHLMY